MLDVFVVFSADVLADLLVLAGEFGGPFECPRLLVSAGVVDRQFNFQVPQVSSLEALDDVHFVGVWMPLEIEPSLIVEADRVYHQRVALPGTNRVPYEGRK